MLWIHGLTAILLVQVRGELTVLPQLLQYCYITVLWIHGLTAILLVQFRGELKILPAVTAVLLHYSALDIWTDCNFVSTV